jgi:preprotein translocase subunit SecF
MELIRPNTKIDFVSSFRWALIVSGVLVIASLVSLLVHGGPNYGVDFTGGTMLQIRFAERPPISSIREALIPLRLSDATIQDVGTGNGGAEFLIRLPIAEEATDLGTRVSTALRERFGTDAFEILREEMVGPRVGHRLRNQAILAVIFATVMMGAYIWFRFELRFGIGAAAALTHDVIIAIGALSLFSYEFDLTIVAALLTVVGFSVNDTVIVSDRIRENLRKNRRDSLSKIINSSINETLSRTILTSGTALLVLLSLFLLGGNVINGFAFTLLVGISVGTYSSIYISSPIVLRLERGRAR